MKQSFKLVIFYLSIYLLAGAFIACNNNASTKDTSSRIIDASTGNEKTNATSQEDRHLTIATLTPDQIKAIDLALGQVENKELTATIKANGALRVPNESRGKATPLFSGVIKNLYIQLGSHVKKGQVIATVTNPEFIQLQETYISLGSKITLAEQEEIRQKALNEGQAGILKNLQSATAAHKELRTKLAALNQQLQLMGINPVDLNNDNMRATLAIKSPIAGTVSQVYAEIGSHVDPGNPVAEIVNNDALHLDLQIFEKDLPMIKLGQIIHFTLTNNPTKEYDAVVYSIGAAFENESKTIPVHCRVKSDKTAMIDQMNITGIVSLSKAVTPAVPNEALVSNGDKDYVFVAIDSLPVNKIGTRQFKKAQVIKGVSEMGYTAVTFVEPVPKGTKVVTQGAFFINAKLTNVDQED